MPHKCDGEGKIFVNACWNLTMLMWGMIGSVSYSGDLSEFLPLIRFCEKVHLGKQTTFGLGKIALLPPGDGAK